MEDKNSPYTCKIYEYVCMYAWIYIYICVYTHIHQIYTHIHTHKCKKLNINQKFLGTFKSNETLTDTKYELNKIETTYQKSLHRKNNSRNFNI